MANADLGCKLEELTQVESYIMQSLLGAQKCLAELGRKDKTNGRLSNEGATEFWENLKKAEKALKNHLQYLSQIDFSTIHEGSSYPALRDQHAALARLSHIDDVLQLIETNKQQQQLEQQQQQQQHHQQQQQQQQHQQQQSIAGAEAMDTSSATYPHEYPQQQQQDHQPKAFQNQEQQQHHFQQQQQMHHQQSLTSGFQHHPKQQHPQSHDQQQKQVVQQQQPLQQEQLHGFQRQDEHHQF